MRTLLIKQPAGLGDIFFLQKIAFIHELHGYNVIWPVISEYIWLKDYIPQYQFVDVSGDFPYKTLYQKQNWCSVYEDEEVKIVTTDGCGNGVETMKSKYNLIHTDWTDWASYFKFKRDHDKENELYYRVLGLKDDSDYAFSMKYMGSPNGYSTALNLPVKSSKRIVYLDYLDGFSLFDWCKVLENASEIHVEGSSIVYVAEILKLRANVLELYSRDSHRHFNGLFKKGWNFNKSPIK
jgi:hypothetical protein